MPDASILHWAALTHSGSRKLRNDDALIAFASGPAGAETLEHDGSRSLDQHDLVFAVADGMGGGNAGDLAASLLLQRMTEIIPETFKMAASGFFPDCLDHLASPAPPAEIVQTLLKRAIDNSGIDDTTLIVIRVNEAANPTI